MFRFVCTEHKISFAIRLGTTGPFCLQSNTHQGCLWGVNLYKDIRWEHCCCWKISILILNLKLLNVFFVLYMSGGLFNFLQQFKEPTKLETWLQFYSPGRSRSRSVKLELVHFHTIIGNNMFCYWTLRRILSLSLWWIVCRYLQLTHTQIWVGMFYLATMLVYS